MKLYWDIKHQPNNSLLWFVSGDHNSESVSLLLPEPMLLHFFVYLWTAFLIFSKVVIFWNPKTTLQALLKRIPVSSVMNCA